MVSFQSNRFTKLLPCTAFTLFIIIPTISYANTDDTNKCRAIQDPEKRVACYDKLFGTKDIGEIDGSNKTKKELDPIEQRAQALMSKTGDSDSPFDGSKARLDGNSNKVLLNDNSFGAEQIQDSSSSSSNRMLALINSIDTNQRELRTLTLSNGQIWREVQSSRLDLDVGDEIIIKKGLVGGYLLTTESSNRNSRVKRIE